MQVQHLNPVTMRCFKYLRRNEIYTKTPEIPQINDAFILKK